MRRLRLTASALLVLASSAQAESWYGGPAGRRRVAHLTAIGIGGVLYVSSETFLKDKLAPLDCRFCTPNRIDRSVRNAVAWSDPAPATRLSDLAAFVVTPALQVTLVVISSRGVDTRVERVLDDVIPIFESAAFTGLLNQTVKFAAGRRRPIVEFGDPTKPHDADDNVSFYSGHPALAFAMTTSAGIVAHKRGYRFEPVIWVSGYLVSAAVGYLRMAADRHYLSDVVVGAAAGTVVGFVVPLAFHDNLRVIPARDGVTAVGHF